MIAAFGMGVVGVLLCQVPKGADASQTPPPAAPAAAAPAQSTPDSSKSWSFKTGGRIRTISCSEDGKLLAVANGNPTMIVLENGTSRVKGDWNPSAEILDARTAKTVAVLKLTTADEDAVLAATPRLSYFEVTALAFSPDGKVVAVGTSIGQVKLYDARTGALLRLLDDQAAKLADSKTPGNWKSLERAMGSVASLAFSADGHQLVTCGGSFGDFSRVFDKSERLDERTTGPGRLKIWDVKTETLKHDLVGHSHATAVAFSPDGTVLASAGSWHSDAETGTGIVIWSARAFTQLRTVAVEANGGTHSVAFSTDGKLMVIGSLSFERDNLADPGTSIISLADVASGVVHWRHTKSGGPEPVAFYSGAVLAMGDRGQSMWFYQVEAGTVLSQLTRAADPVPGGRWNGFTFAKRGGMWVIGGEDADHKGSVEVIYPEGS